MKHKTNVETVDKRRASWRYALHQVFPITVANFDMNQWLYLWPVLQKKEEKKKRKGKKAPQQTIQLLLLEKPVLTRYK